MNVLDLDGECQVEREHELLSRLRSVRRGPDGAFVLDHGRDESLWLHINGDAAFLWFCPDRDGRHPGYVPDGMWAGDRHDVRFQMVGGSQADSIYVPWWQLLLVDAAYQAAIEFLHSSSPPASVTWFEL